MLLPGACRSTVLLENTRLQTRLFVLIQEEMCLWMLNFALKHCSQRVRRVVVDHIKYFSIIGYGFNKSGIQFMARDYALFLQTSK